MKNRLPMVAASLIVSLLLLFGGFYVYQKIQIEMPIHEVLRKESHLDTYHVQATPNEVTVNLAPKASFSLQKDFKPLQNRLQSIIGHRSLKLFIDNKGEKELLASWQRINFGIQEGIAQQRYTQIPETVEKEAKRVELKSEVFMDDQYLYIELKKDNSRLYRVLPLYKSGREVQDNG